MFNTSSQVTTSIAIYPNTNDNWDVLSPFPGETLTVLEEGFVLSDSMVNNDGSLRLLPKRLIDISSIKNEINFLVKTNLKQTTIPASQGIGGTSKLKDFNFTITKDYVGVNSMSIDNIIGLYGRKIILFMSDSLYVENPNDDTKSRIFFTGRINSAKRKDNTIIFTVRGLLDTSNPLVGGAVVKQSDGSQVNEAIVFGDSGDMYVPISKRENSDGTISLQFSQSNDFIIKSLHVKGGSQSEPIWLDVETPYDIVNNEIIFNHTEYTNMYLRASVGTGLNIRPISIIDIVTSYEVAIKFKTDPVTITPGYKARFYGERDSPYSLRAYNCYMDYLRKEVVAGETLYFFKCGWEFAYGKMRTWIEDGSWSEGGITYEPNLYLMPGANYYDIDYVEIHTNNPLEKEIDARPCNIDSMDTEYDYQPYNEIKDIIDEYSKTRYSTFQQIPTESLVIQINDEKMLVVYTEKTTGYPTGEVADDAPTSTLVWVYRGWNGTIVANHNANDPVHIVSDFKEKILVKYTRPLQNLTTVSPGGDWHFSYMTTFLSGQSSLHVTHLAGLGNNTNVRSQQTWLGLDWRLPDLFGDLFKVILKGEASVNFDPSVAYDDTVYKESFINIALHTLEDGSETDVTDLRIKRRRIFGHKISSSIANRDIFKLANHYYTPPPTQSEVLNEGNYSLILSQSRIYPYDEHIFYSGLQYLNLYDIKNYDELKEASMYMVFNAVTNYAIYNMRSFFKVSRPTLEIYLKTELDSSDVYAKIIPKSLFDDPSDEFTVGTNCKIAWHPYDYYTDKVDYNAKNLIAVSDDDSIGFAHYGVFPNMLFSSPYYNPNVDYPGILVKDVIRPNAIGKIYPTQNLKEDFIMPSVDVDNYVRTSGFPNGLLNVGKTFLENGNAYIWVDQDNNKIKIVGKSISNNGNPVRIIENMLNSYYTSINIDTDSFNIAAAKREGWNARLLVEDEKPIGALIDLIAKNHGLMSYENNEGNIAIIALDPPSGDDSLSDIDEHMLLFKNEEKSSLLDFQEEFTFINYLITDMDVYYDYINNKYNGFIDFANLSNQGDFTIAQQFTEDTIKVKLELQTIFDKATANKSNIVKMIYHQVPTRIIKMKTSLAAIDYKIGQWVTCSCSDINEVSNRIYLILSKGAMPSFIGKKPYLDFTLLEFNWEDLVLRIQEVPNQSININYREQITTSKQIQEIPNT